MSTSARPTTRAGREPRRPAAPGGPPSVPAPASAPLLLAAGLVAAACIAVSVSFRIFDADVWQNLTVGKAIWQMHAVPKTQLWTWPTYGAPDVGWAWGFRALLWPVWERGGVAGLFAWRWITALAAFGLVWAAARRMGARGFVPLVVMVLCSLVWRGRSQVRPETLVAVLLALEIWILETRRHGGKNRALWLAAILWLWVNAHSSYFIGFALIGFHLLEAWRASSRGAGPRMEAAARRPAAAPLLLAALTALAVSFVNPYGWRLVWQPFDFFLHHRNEPIFRTIGELAPIDWGVSWKSGLPLLLAGWPVLALARARRLGFDGVEALCCAFFTALALPAQRFAGLYAIAAAPYVARDLDSLLPRPAWMARAPGAALAALACVAIGIPEWTRPELPLGIGFHWNVYPVAACDFIEAHGVRGRGFNQFGNAGYQIYRFWPDRGRLPFMDIHQAGTAADRSLYAWAQQRAAAWRMLDGKYGFDYVLLGRAAAAGDSLRDLLDQDTTWALVFLDDAAALYVRRGGPLAGVARDFAYRELPAGAARLGPLGAACAADSALRARVRAELEREVAGSPYHAQALMLLANVALAEGRLADARSLLERALALDSFKTGAHQRLAVIALAEGRPRDALREVEGERRVNGAGAGLDVLAGRAWQRLGDPGRARAAWRAALRRQPEDAEARDLLDSLERGGAR